MKNANKIVNLLLTMIHPNHEKLDKKIDATCQITKTIVKSKEGEIIKRSMKNHIEQ